MSTLAGDNVREIIRKHFDERMSMAVVTYIIDKGWEYVRQITEEEIKEISGNAFMTDVFLQSLVRTAVRVCRETNQIDDFMPFIINHLHVPNAATKSVCIYKNDVSDYNWELFTETFGLDYEENYEDIQMIELNANLVGYWPNEED